MNIATWGISEILDYESSDKIYKFKMVDQNVKICLIRNKTVLWRSYEHSVMNGA